MNDNTKNISNELVIARDLIDMAKDYANDFDALEYLSGFAFNLARLHGNEAVDWDSIFSILDQAYSRQDTKILDQLMSISNKINAQIDSSN